MESNRDFIFESNTMFEIRAIEPKTSKKGKKYATIRFESPAGLPFSLYYPYDDFDKYSKGDLVNIYIYYNPITKIGYCHLIELV